MGVEWVVCWNGTPGLRAPLGLLPLCLRAQATRYPVTNLHVYSLQNPSYFLP
jgi:hypothetical protein